MQKEIHVKHILVKSKDEAQRIYERAEAGEDFDDLAQNSIDEKVDLGWLSRGKMPPEFDNIAFPMPKGMVSLPVKTEQGYHVIKKIDNRL